MEPWMDVIVDMLGCQSPKLLDTVFLHGFTLGGHLYPMMKAHLLAQKLGKLMPTKDYFLKVWYRKFGRKGERLVGTAFGKRKVRVRDDSTVNKCGACQRNQLRLRGAKNPIDRQTARDILQDHLAFVFDQRAAYTAHRNLALLGFALSAGTDATSSWFTQLPMASKGTGAVRSWSRVDMKVTIAVLHGCKGLPEYTARVCTPAWVQGGGNLQMTLFFEASFFLRFLVV
jgi:hypothetical protein